MGRVRLHVRWSHECLNHATLLCSLNLLLSSSRPLQIIVVNVHNLWGGRSLKSPQSCAAYSQQWVVTIAVVDLFIIGNPQNEFVMDTHLCKCISCSSGIIHIMQLPDNIPMSCNHSACQTLLKILQTRDFQQRPKFAERFFINNFSPFVFL